MSDNSFTPIESVGRDGLIKEIEQLTGHQHPDLIRGIGDDAAVIDGGGPYAMILTSESFVEGVDFDLTYTPLRHLGYKVVSAVISDVLAMNAKPSILLINIAIPNRISKEMIKELYEGIDKAGKDYNIQVAGGDITASRGPSMIQVTAYGRTKKENVVYRSGAQIDDAICVSGELGGALAGLKVLLREKKKWLDSGEDTFHPDLSEYEEVVRRQLLPVARLDVIELMETERIAPTAMTDLSQGISHDLNALLTTSKVGGRIYEAALPINMNSRKVADELNEDIYRYALYGGEDYELLFTLPEDEINQLLDKAVDITIIGKVVPEEEGCMVQTFSGKEYALESVISSNDA